MTPFDQWYMNTNLQVGENEAKAIWRAALTTFFEHAEQQFPNMLIGNKNGSVIVGTSLLRQYAERML